MDKFTKEEIQQLITGLELLQTKRFNSIFMDPPDAEQGVELTYEGFLQLALSLGNKRYQIDMLVCGDCGGYVANFSMWAFGQLFRYSSHYENDNTNFLLSQLGLESLAESAVNVYQIRQEQERIEEMLQAFKREIATGS